MGNEQYDSFDLAPEMYRIAKETDPTRPVIDSDGCGFKHKDRSTLDFLVVQFGEGGSIGFGDGKYGVPADVRKPVVCHEMGYFVTLPDLSQIDLFKGGLRPYWLTSTRDLAAKRGVSVDYAKWLEASYQLQAVCLKTNIEAARRSRLGGMSVWLFQDYPNCAEGVVDMFWRPKGISAEKFRTFNAPTVLLLDAPRRAFRFGEIAELKVLVSRFEDAPTEKGVVQWDLKSGRDVLSSGRKEGLRVGEGVQEILPLSLHIGTRPRAEKLTLAVELSDENGRTSNEWDLWAFPEAPPAAATVATALDAEMIDRLEKGGRVLLLEPGPVFPTEKTNYRLSSWARSCGAPRDAERRVVRFAVLPSYPRLEDGPPGFAPREGQAHRPVHRPPQPPRQPRLSLRGRGGEGEAPRERLQLLEGRPRIVVPHGPAPAIPRRGGRRPVGGGPRRVAPREAEEVRGVMKLPLSFLSLEGEKTPSEFLRP